MFVVVCLGAGCVWGLAGRGGVDGQVGVVWGGALLVLVCAGGVLIGKAILSESGMQNRWDQSLHPSLLGNTLFICLECPLVL